MDSKKTEWLQELPWSAPTECTGSDEIVAVPSATIRDELRTTGRVLTDFEMAVLLDRSRIPWQEKLLRLTALRDRTTDATLRQELARLMSSRTKQLESFLANADGRALYRSLRVWKDDSESEGTLFRTAAEAWIELSGDVDPDAKEIRIDKMPLLETADEEPHVVSMILGVDGRFLSLTGVSEAEWEAYTSANFVELPHPFQRGDIVRTADGKVHGVVEAASAYQPNAVLRWPPGPWNEQEEPFRLAVFDEETGLFSSTAAIQPVELEYHEVSSRVDFETMDGLLYMLSEMYEGNGWIPDFTIFTDSYRRDRGYRE